MLEYTQSGSGARFELLVLHDDAAREFAYGPALGLPNPKLGAFTQALYEQAHKNSWTVVSMKNDWKTVFPAAQSAVTAIDILLEPDATMLRHAQANNARLLEVFPKGFARRIQARRCSSPVMREWPMSTPWHCTRRVMATRRSQNLKRRYRPIPMTAIFSRP
jgi:hypothetical protein